MEIIKIGTSLFHVKRFSQKKKTTRLSNMRGAFRIKARVIYTQKKSKVFEIEINRGLGGGAVVKERIFVPNHLVEKFNRERTDVLF